jgi:hypothetical protein
MQAIASKDHTAHDAEQQKRGERTLEDGSS